MPDKDDYELRTDFEPISQSLPGFELKNEIEREMIGGERPVISLSSMSPEFLREYAPQAWLELYGSDENGLDRSKAWLDIELRRTTHEHRQDDEAFD